MIKVDNFYTINPINSTDNPTFKHVDATFILTLEDSNRKISDPFLLNLTKETFEFINKGYKQTKKPYNILSALMDINYTYYSLFKYINKYTNYKNVLVLEDDAQTLNDDVKHYNYIDNYVNRTNFDLLSLGSGGIFFNTDDPRIHNALFGGFTQCIIYSKDLRQNLILKLLKKKFEGLYDIDYLDIKLYYLPLIVQLFPPTENRNNWYFSSLMIFFIEMLNLDKDINEWNKLYWLSKNAIYIILLILIIILILLK